MNINEKIIALDCDGILLDYNLAYPRIYEEALGRGAAPKHPGAYHAHNAFEAPMTPEEKTIFLALFDQKGWKTMRALPGALEACQKLHSLGHELVVVSSMPQTRAEDRAQNLSDLGFPIQDVIGTGRADALTNSKAVFLARLAPVAFADDLLSNFKNIPASIHAL